MVDTDRLVDVIQEFIDDHKITTPEVIYQHDAVIQKAYELLEVICEIVGYARDEEDDETDEEDY